jgi:hypothetical protein
MNLFKKKQNSSERALKLIFSFFLVPIPLFLDLSLYTFIICAKGWILMFSALSGVCMIYKVLIDACKTQINLDN